MITNSININITKKQSIAWNYLSDYKTNEVLFGGGAGSGKSFIGCLYIISQAIRFEGTRWLIGRTKLSVLRQTTLNTFFEVCSMMKLQRDIHYKYNSQLNLITFDNGSEVLLKDLDHKPSDPNFDDLGSLEITGAFVDECNQVSEKAISIITSRIRFRLDEYKLYPKILMTCNPAKNWVYNKFYKPHKDGNLQEDRKFIQALLTDNDYIDPNYINNLNKLDYVNKQRLLYGNWDYEDDNYLIPFINLNKIFTNVNKNLNKELPEFTNVTHLSIDVARFGSDNSVVILWNELNVVGIESWNGMSITDSAKKIQDIIDYHGINMRNVIIDSDGVGGGLVDILIGCYSIVNGSRALNNDNYFNLKTQCYYKLIDKINNCELKIYNCKPDQRVKLEQELQILKRKNMDADGKVQITSKDDIKKLIGRSPDYSDAMAYRMVHEIKNEVNDWKLLF
jgi:hypothetical protein